MRMTGGTWALRRSGCAWVLILAWAALYLAGAASAQGDPRADNPLRRSAFPAGAPSQPSAQPQPSAQAPSAAPTTEPEARPRRARRKAAESGDGGSAKPKRQRSAAQLANDERMRACGREWRASKAQLQAKGQTWRGFSVECRARLKAAGR